MASVDYVCPSDVPLDADTIAKLIDTFTAVDADRSGAIDAAELGKLFESIGEPLPPDMIPALIAKADKSGDSRIDFPELCRLVHSHQTGALAHAVMRHAEITEVKGAVGKHSYAVEEKLAFSEHLNNCLGSDSYLSEHGYLPIDPTSNGLFVAIQDGILICKLINLAVADQVDERALNFPKPGKKLNPWEIKENTNLAIGAAKSIGCSIVNIHAGDITNCVAESKEYLVLGMIWQIVKIQLLAAINLRAVPELVRLLGEDEELPDLLKLPPEQVLLRWVNFHMANSGTDRRVGNFGSDLADGEAYIRVLNQIDSSKASLDMLSNSDPDARAINMIEAAKRIGIPAIIQPVDVTSGNKRLNLAFCAQIFNTNHGMSMTEESAKIVEAAGVLEEPDEGTREERTFRMWMNSLDLEGRFVHHLYNDLANDLSLLYVIDRVEPGTVDWKRVNKTKLNRFKLVENANYAVYLGRDVLKLNMPATGGVDIMEGNRTLVLGFVWQLMRRQVLKMLREVGGASGSLTDADIVAAANKIVSDSGRSSSIASFKDPSISTGVFLLDLLASVEERALNPDLITPGATDEEKELNAKYVLSVARKIGALVFCTWEDIVEVKSKMVMTLVASIMHSYRAHK